MEKKQLVRPQYDPVKQAEIAEYRMTVRKQTYRQGDPFVPSRVPAELYPAENEAAQREVLKHSAQLAAYAEYRAGAKEDPWNPSYHFYSPDGKLNDPNGLCFWNGYWHLFYQVYPKADPRPHWGHMCSKDLVRWEDLPLALYPDDKAYATWSGNTVVDDDRVVAMYHGRWAGNCVATSSDPLLLNWEKMESNPVIPLLPDRATQKGRPYDVFDPFIWKEGKDFYALSGIMYGEYDMRGRDYHSEMVEHLFHSQDLEHWTYMGELAPDGFPQMPLGNDGACPYFVPLGNRYVLFMFSHRSGAYAFLGDYDKVTHRFTPDRLHQFNFGPVGCSSYQAPCAAPDGNGGVYLVFNVTDRDRTLERDGVMSMMYHVTLGEDDQLRIVPVEGISNLHGACFRAEHLKLPMFERKTLDAHGRALDLQMQIDRGSARTIRIELLRSADGREHTDVLLYMPCVPHRATQAFVTVDTTYASLSPASQSRIPETTMFLIGEDEPVNVRILLDRCMLEVFVNDRVVLTQMVYPTLEDSEQVALTALGGDAELISGHIWEMNSIYE